MGRVPFPQYDSEKDRIYKQENNANCGERSRSA